MALVLGSSVVYVEKHPWSVKRIPIDWTEFAAGSAISDSLWTDATPSASGLTLSGEATDVYVTSVLLSEGTVGVTGYIENRVTFSDGRKEVVTIAVPISTKVPAA